MKDRNLPASDNWETPKEIYDVWNAEFHFDFDPCPLNTGTIPPERDALLIEWGQCNYVNPPYSRKLKEAFVLRGVEMMRRGKTSVFLLPVSTSTKLFHEIIQPLASEIRFLRGRIAFHGVNTKGEYTETGKGMHDSMLVIFKGVALD